MEKLEFDRAVTAYLNGTANSWQTFIVEDYYDSFAHIKDFLDSFTPREQKHIGRNLFVGIDDRKDEPAGTGIMANFNNFKNNW